MAAQVEAMVPESIHKNDDSNDDYEETAFFHRRWCCFWNLPRYRLRRSHNWERISTSDSEQSESGNLSRWSVGIKVLIKVREWSELVAGPKWKTFIRQFNKSPARPKPGKFQYDPFSYALNFDEGPGQNGQFSSRYAAIPVQNSQLKDVS